MPRHDDPAAPPMPSPEFDLKTRFEDEARLFMRGPDNDNRSKTNPEPAFAEPFFGYCPASDHYWETVKEAAGQDHWTPLEAFQKAFPGDGAGPGGLTVAVIVCPQTKATVADQKKASGFPAERWIRSRFFHDQVVSKLCSHLAGRLAARGVRAVVPDQVEGFGTFPHPRFQIASNWSHRHAAFAAGLGTFGLCDALITRVGKAHRLGSLVIESRLEPTPRPYEKPYEYCLFHSAGRCRKCVGRCPAGALSPAGHDKTLCGGFLDAAVPRIKELYPDLAGAYGCGLCQSAVPCGERIPGRARA
ncbi:MAG: hypothetical protein LBP95_08455 [Deltaproteobacteria bacterium]|nr:hypothetical protein [Deltaproteobacteria bacterium]